MKYNFNNIASFANATNEILIKPAQIRKIASELKTLSSTISSRNLSVEFSYSQGDVVSQLIEYADNMMMVGEEIALLIDKTAVALRKTAYHFEYVDGAIASLLSKEGK